MKDGHEGLRLEPFDPAQKRRTDPVPDRRTHYVPDAPADRSNTTVNVIARQRELDDLRRRQNRLTSLTALLLLALVGLGVYGYYTLNQIESPLSQFPALQQTVAAVDQRVVAEDKLAGWTGDWNQLRARVSGVEARLKQNLTLANQNAQELTAQLHQRMQAEMDERWQPLEARLTQLESERAQERARVDQVEQQVAALRTDTGRDLSVLNEATSRTERDLNQLAQQVKRERVDFELAEDSTHELAPGISMRVTSTDVSYQRIRGWLWLLPDRRTIRVQNLGAQQALVFHVRGNDVPHELVITQVGKDSVAGYLLLPPAAEGATTSSAAPAGRPGASH